MTQKHELEQKITKCNKNIDKYQKFIMEKGNGVCRLMLESVKESLQEEQNKLKKLNKELHNIEII